MASNDVDYAGGKQGKQPRSRMQSVCRAIYNPDKGEFFGRNCGSWAKIGVFYLVFYSCLAGFFAVMLVGFFATLDEKAPTMTGMYSLIKQNPGMGFRPLEKIETTLVKFNKSEVDSYSGKINDILSYLRDNQYIDDNNQTLPAQPKVFDLSTISAHCFIDHNDLNKSFGYHEGKPCILLKINRVYGWKPEAFGSDSNDTDHYKAALEALGGQEGISSKDIGITCEGENDGDADAMGEVQFYPSTGFSTDYFPYEGQDGYKAPLVWAKFNNPTPGVLIQVWCRMWAKNVRNDHKNDKTGSVRFELMVDSKPEVKQP